MYADVGDDDGAGEEAGVDEDIIGELEVEADVGTTTMAVVEDEEGCADVEGWT